MLSKDDILGALPSLTHEELSAVVALAGHLLGGPMVAPAADLAPAHAVTFDALVTALGAHTSYASIAQTKTGQLFRKRLPDFIKFLNTHFHSWDQTKISQLALLKLLFTLIKDDLQKRDVTPSLGMVVSNMIRIGDVFNDAFPGYLDAGAGNVILRKFIR